MDRRRPPLLSVKWPSDQSFNFIPALACDHRLHVIRRAIEPVQGMRVRGGPTRNVKQLTIESSPGRFGGISSGHMVVYGGEPPPGQRGENQVVVRSRHGCSLLKRPQRVGRQVGAIMWSYRGMSSSMPCSPRVTICSAMARFEHPHQPDPDRPPELQDPARFEQGLVQVITGGGKGKTTAAFGLGLRAVGHGLRVLALQFMKGDTRYGEFISVGYLPNFSVERFGTGGLVDMNSPSEPDKDEARRGLERAREAMLSGHYDVIILDEI